MCTSLYTPKIAIFVFVPRDRISKRKWHMPCIYEVYNIFTIFISSLFNKAAALFAIVVVVVDDDVGRVEALFEVAPLRIQYAIEDLMKS